MTWINKNKTTLKKRDRNLDGGNKYYHSMSWRNLRVAYMRDHPLCERCLEKGIAKPAEEVHHIRFFESGKTEQDKWFFLLNENNLMSVCRECHQKIHAYAKKYNLNECDHY